MVKQHTIAGPISRAIGFRLHTEMGDAGEDAWAEIAGATRLGRSRLSWRGGKPPPVDVVDFNRRIAYQIKVVTDPRTKVSFSGAHKNVKGRRIGGKRGRGLPRYVGTPEDKLEDIKRWLVSSELEPVLIVMVLDEDANRLGVFAKRGVHNVTTKEMTPIGTIDNDAGEWVVPRVLQSGRAELQMPWIPASMPLETRFPNIPEFLRSSTSGEIVPEIAGVRPMFRRPVRVRSYRRRR